MPREVTDPVARLLARPVGASADPARMRTLVELLGRPDRAYPSIHVTGAEDGASIARMVTCVLGALGLTAGSYAASHLQDIAERVRVALDPIDADTLDERARELEPFLTEAEARHADPLSFAEAMAALALAHFADAPVDVAVLEASWPGAGDPTAVAGSDVVILGALPLETSAGAASVDDVVARHTEVVNEAGVVISAPQTPAAEAALAQAVSLRGAQLVMVGRDVAVAERRLAVGGQHLDLEGVTGNVDDVYLPLHGPHQAVNAVCAVAAIEGFLGFAGGLAPEVFQEGFAAVRMPGHLEVVRRPDAAPVVVDGAATPRAAQLLATALTEEFTVRHRVLVAAMLADADVHGTLEPLLAVADHVVVTALDDPRSASVARLAAVGQDAGQGIETAEDLPTALELASGLATPEDLVVVAGSSVVAGQARTALGLPVG